MTINHFEHDGKQYALHRPTYPEALAQTLADMSPSKQLAVDIGCGTGQLTTLLAEHFEHVTGFDSSETQIANAAQHSGAEYRLGHAEAIDISDSSADLVIAAQAAHWFDLDSFYDEFRRVAKPNGLLALVSYGVPQLNGDVGERFSDFYWKDIHEFWPAERKHVERGYETLEFPFSELKLPEISVQRDWNFSLLLGYINTWSAMRNVEKAGHMETIQEALNDIKNAWGDPNKTYKVTWPIKGRVGRLEIN